MKFKTIFKPILAAAALVLAVSCAKDDLVPDNTLPSTGEEVMVSLKYSVDALTAGDGIESLDDALTRTIPDDLNAADVAPGIFNMWIIQFDGATLGSKMLGAPRFLSEADLSAATLYLPLMETSGSAYTVFIANMDGGETYSWNLSNETTFADVVKRIKTITDEQGTYKTIGTVPTKTLLLSAYTTDPINGSASLAPAFKRNVAKVTLNLTNASGSGVTIKSVRLRNVPTSISYTDVAIPLLPTYYDNIVVFDYDAIKTGLPAVGATESFSWYVPRNERGTSASTDIKDKTAYAPNYATYFEVTVANDNNSTSVFRVYPGANQTNDYNIAPNKHYKVGLNVTGIGTDPDDSRVQTFPNIVEFKGMTGGRTSNSFIVNPAPAGAGVREFRVPLNQITRYWSGAAEGYGAASTISETDKWNARILWSDFDTNGIVTMKNISGIGYGNDQYFSFTLPEAAAAGNFVVLVDNGTTALWSWHFWITDYTPNRFIKKTISDGIYTYPVPGGQVERYAPYGGYTAWTNVYVGQVMMDRNLGAVESFFSNPGATNATSVRGILHYQFGRKDPIPALNASDIHGAEVHIQSGPVSIAESVANPNKFYTNFGGNWSNEATSGGFEWNDPLATGEQKSIYDPCPPGWRMPILYIWWDFYRVTDTGEPITVKNTQRDLGWDYGRGIGSPSYPKKGLRYWPGTGLTDPAMGRIWYPSTGGRRSDSGVVTDVGGGGYYWSITTFNDNFARYLIFNAAGVTTYPNDRSLGYAVRCISEGEF